MKECISKSFKEEIFADMSQVPLSLSFDESASKAGPTYLCTYVRYLKDGDFSDKLLSLNEIREGSTSLDLYNIIMTEVFMKKRRLY